MVPKTQDHNRVHPTRKADAERLRGAVQWIGPKELLNANVFYTLPEVRAYVEEWMDDYNHHRPHESLGYRAPVDLLEAIN